MIDLLFAAVGLVLGAVGTLLLTRSTQIALRERLLAREADAARLASDLATASAARDLALRDLADTRATLAAERAASTEKIAALAEARERLLAEFRALSADALAANNARFLELARESLGGVRQAADGDLEKRQLAIAALVQPLRDTLGQVEARLTAFDQSRAASASALAQHLQTLAQSQAALQHETARLSTALRSTTTAGTWGELQLRRVVELAGMTDYCDFTEQSSVTADRDEGRARLRPDLVVRLPGGQRIVIDAKAPNEAYRDAASAPDEPTRSARLADHAAKVAGHVAALSAKAYWEQFQPSPEFVVLFLPGDQFLAAALSADPDLLERAIQKRVLLATPASLIALLKAAAYGWRQETASRNAEEIAARARDFHERVVLFVEHLAKIGPALDQAAKAYNSALGSLEARVLPAGRRLEDLGARSGKNLPSPAPADVSTRNALPPRD